MSESLFSFFKHRNIKPIKRLGQNFLIDRSVLHKIIEAAELSADDVILEVGPGAGVLTLELAKRVKKVIAVEKDKRLIRVLKKVLEEENVNNVDVIERDVRKIDIRSLFCHSRDLPATLSLARRAGGENQENQPGSRIKRGMTTDIYKVVANIPYYLTSPLIRNFLESDIPPRLIVLLIQKEVARRICAAPPKMTLLSVAVQFYAEPKIISSVSKKSFWPQPKVDSAIIKITPRIRRHPDCLRKACFPFISGSQEILRQAQDDGFIQEDNKFISSFFRVIRAGFKQPRKQIINNLSTGLKIERDDLQKLLLDIGIKPTQRPGELTVDNWRKITVLLVEKILYNKT